MADPKVNVRITGQDDELRKALDRASKGVKSFAEDTKKLGKELATKLSAGVAVVAAGVTAVIHRTTEFADRIDKASIRTGLSREQLQQLRYATDQVGGSMETVESAIAAFTNRLPEVARGSGDTFQALQAIGVSARNADGSLRSMGELFPEIIRGLSGVANETERNAIATRIFGRGAAELTPLIAAGGAEMDRLMQRASDLGLVLGDESISGFVQFKDLMSEVSAQLGAVGARIAAAFLPIIQKMVGFVQDKVVPVFQRFADWIEGINEHTKETVAIIALVVGALGPLVLGISGVASMLAFLLTPAGLVFAALAALAAIAVVVVRNWDRMKLATATAWVTMKEAVFTAVDGILGMLERLAGKVPVLGDKIRDLRSDFRQFADESLARSSARIQQLEGDVTAARTATDEMTASVDRAAGATGSGGLSLLAGNADKVRDAIQKLVTGLRDAAVMHELLGDRFDLTAAKASEYEAVVRTLVAAGVSLEATVGPNGETLGELAARYKELAGAAEDAQAAERAANALHQEGISLAEQLRTAEEQYAATLEHLQKLRDAGAISEETLARAKREAAEALHAEGRALEQALMTPMEKYQAQLEELDRLLARGSISQETWARGVAEAGQALDEQLGRVRDLRISIEEMAGRGADAVIDFASGAKSAISDFARHALAEIGRVIVRTLVLRTLFPSLSFAGGGDFLSSIFSIPGRAGGGPVLAGRPYWVGEKGRELMVPSSNGTVIPNAALAGGGVFRLDTSSLPPYPRVMSPEALAVDDYWRRAYTAMHRDHQARGGR